MRPPREDTLPWYKQFWPWFLISLPLAVVIASIVTINIAIRTDDGLVSDDYYKEGLAVHKDADSTAKAKALGIAGTLNLAVDTGAITFTLDDNSAAADPTLSMKVVHPTRPDQDQTVLLTRLTAARYAGRMQPLGPANWKLEIHPEDKSWRIEGRLLMPGSGETRLD
ncbi:MAG TPA: FixH family protein [Gammaproteobacteria bacterium]|nr:FixH family protein [Gammaproteobacteria bacterium]